MVKTHTHRSRPITAFLSAAVALLIIPAIWVKTVDRTKLSDDLWGLLFLVLIPATGALVLLGAVLYWLDQDRDGASRLERAAENPSRVLRGRIRQVNIAFAEAASLMDDLRRDLHAQQAARDALLAQAEKQQRLLEIDKEQAEEIRQILVGETKATIRAERRTQWMFFALGLAASIPVGVAINLLVP